MISTVAVAVDVSSLLCGITGAVAVSRWGMVTGLVDCPNERSSHQTPTPKGGGIGILGAFILTGLMVDTWSAFFFPACAISILSLWGDRVELSPKLRLGLQFVLAGAFIFSTPLLFDGALTRGLWGALLGVFIVGTANFYNFMDGINGIAAVTGGIGFGLLAALSTRIGVDPRATLLAAGMSFACFGFLPFNMPRARVFMGDVGSVLLGFVFAGLVIIISETLVDFVVAAGFLFLFYADELTTMRVRIADGENLSRPHRRHFYQILANELGIDHWKISTGYGLVQLTIGSILLGLRPFGLLAVLLFVCGGFGAFTWVSFRLRKTLRTNRLPENFFKGVWFAAGDGDRRR